MKRSLAYATEGNFFVREMKTDTPTLYNNDEDDKDEESCSSLGSPREIERMNLDLTGMSSDLKRANILNL